MARMEYYHDSDAPQPQHLLPAAFAVVRDDTGRVLLVRRADDGYWELPGGRIEVGETASAAVIREVAEQTGVPITVTGLAGVYSDPGHVLAYPHGEVYQQVAVCFHAVSQVDEAQPDCEESTATAWFDPGQAIQPGMLHPAVGQRLTDALAHPHRPHFD